MKKTRTQLRGICPVCGGLFATKDGRLVSHGYTLKFGFQSGACHGVTAPHLGHKDCPDWIKSYQSSLKEFEAETRAAMNASGVEPKRKRQLQRSLSGITYMQKLLEERLEKWQEVALIEVDLEVEEAEQRKEREANAQKVKAEREAKALEKEAKRKEREAKTAAKWEKICSQNTHQVELDGEIILEWQASYQSRTELERDHSKRINDHFDSVSMEIQERINASWRLIHRIRSIESGKQLHKY